MRTSKAVKGWLYGLLGSATLGIALLAAFDRVPQPRATLDFVGYSTNYTVRNEYYYAVLCFTNSGKRALTFTTDLNEPPYTVFQKINDLWEEKPYVPSCGLSVRERTMKPGESIVFKVSIDPLAGYRFGVPYRSDASKSLLQRFTAALGVRRQAAPEPEEVVMSPFIQKL